MKRKGRLAILGFLLICAEFLRVLVVAFLGADIALSYSKNGVKITTGLFTIIFTVFGIYGFLTYVIKSVENYFHKNKYRPI